MWFRELEPPAGGAERLQRCLEEAARPATGVPERVAIVGAGAAVLALALALFVGLRSGSDADRPAPADLYQAASFDRLLGRPMERTELTATIGDQTVPISQVDSSNPKVRIYRID
jgi:hypothetical protein